MTPTALILQATGTNRDQDVALALQMAGARAEIVPLTRMRAGERSWKAYQILVLPGGFSYADALGAGKLLALDLQAYFAAEVSEFVASGKPVIGICNGFQALVKAGLLPAISDTSANPLPQATLTFNEHGRFECRWVYMQAVSRHCLWTNKLATPIYCPVAHGEGRFVSANPAMLASLQAGDQVALVYADENGRSANGTYPLNPNGSHIDIAGICNPNGNVIGLMPHPENHIITHQHPRWTRGEKTGSGLPLFINGVRYAAQC